MTATSSAVYQTNIPEQLLPYQERLLNRAEAFTDVLENPYQQYQGERVAQFSPLQQQAMEAAGQMGVAGQIGAATDIAGIAGLSALGTQYDPMNYRSRSFTQPGAAESFMSPYMQNVVDVQQREAKRQADIASTARGAQAVRAGAFGGSRQAIENAEANRALQTQLGQIQATGLQSAFQQAQQQFNQEQAARQAAAQMREQSRQFGAGLGMQGLGVGLQAAGQLGQLGQQQFGQQQQAIQTQAGLGQMEQQRAQDILNAQYQDFQNYQNYPFKTLGFMSDILRGTPLTQTSGSIYQAPPTATQNLMSLGLGAYGLNQLFPNTPGRASGGAVSSYADGGSVMSRANKERIVGDMHPYGLPRALQGAMARGDMETAQAAQEEMSMDAAIRRGIAAAAPDDIGVGYASGGIVAFADGDLVQAPTTSAEAASRLYNRTLPKRAEGEDYVSAVKGIRGGLEGLYEPSEAIPLYQQMIKQQEARVPEIEREGRGLMALRAAAALQKAGVTSGDRYAGAFEAVASSAEKTTALKKAANDEIMKSRLLMAQANDARKKGLTDLAVNKQAEAENRADKAFELSRAADIELYKGLGTQERLDKEITARSKESAADRESRERVAQLQAEAQRYAADKPGELERMMTTFNNILSGKESFAGQTGEKGVEAYTNSLAQAGAARYGVRYTGKPDADKTEAQITTALSKDDEYKMLKTQRSQLGIKEKLTPQEQAKLDRIDKRIGVIEQRVRNQYKNKPTGDAGDTGGGMTPPPQAIDALRNNPALRPQFDAKYGRGAAARYLGE